MLNFGKGVLGTNFISEECYKDWYDSKYNTGIFTIENDPLLKSWGLQCHDDYRFFRDQTTNMSLWESHYKPGIAAKDLVFEDRFLNVIPKLPEMGFYPSLKDLEHSYIIGSNFNVYKEVPKILEAFVEPNKEVKGFEDLLGFTSKVYIENDCLTIPGFYWKKGLNFGEETLDIAEYSISKVPAMYKGVVPGDFVYSLVNEENKIEKLISMTRILGPGDILEQDRIHINPNTLDFLTLEKKIYNIDYLDNLNNKFLESLIDTDEPLKELDGVDVSYNNIGQDVLIGLKDNPKMEGYFGLEKIMYELNPLPSCGWLIDFSFFMLGTLVLATGVWGFYFLLGKVKRYVDLNGEWDPNYKYWHPLIDHRTSEAKAIEEGFLEYEYFQKYKEMLFENLGEGLLNVYIRLDYWWYIYNSFEIYLGILLY